MKKFTSKVLMAAAILSMTAMSAFAAEPTYLVDFGAGFDHPTSGAARVTIEQVDDHATFTTTEDKCDSYVYLDDINTDFEKMQWVKVRVWNESVATAIELFGACNGAGLTGPEVSHVKIEANKAEWVEYITHIPTSNVQTVQDYKDPQYWIDECSWNGTVSRIRLDPMWQEVQNEGSNDFGGMMPKDSTIKIDYIAFFATEEDAKAYTHNAAPAPEAAPETTTPEAPAAGTGAAQTADMAAAAVLASVLALGTAVVVSKKR